VQVAGKTPAKPSATQAPAPAATTPKPASAAAKPARPAKAKVPIAHIAHKKPKSHGQTIVPASTDPSMAEPTTALTPAAQKTVPSTDHEQKKNNHHDLGIALGVTALLALVAGTYITRRRLRGRSTPA
jgi:hypothetical protein